MARHNRPLRTEEPLPEGPPLHLELPGRATEHLSPFVLPKRLARLRSVLDRRTRHLTALLDGVHDPHNLSACMRTCDAMGVQHLHVVPQPGPALRLSTDVASGAERWLSIHVHRTTGAAVDAIRAEGYRIAATDLAEVEGLAPPVPLKDVPVDRPLCIAFGNEHEGISQALRDACDLRVTIPMYGFVESFNVSVAFAIALTDLRTRHVASLGEAGTVGDLGELEKARILDRWVVEDVPRARRVLAELARRATDGGLSGDPA